METKMRMALSLILIPSILLAAGGPRFGPNYDDGGVINREFENVYHDIKSGRLSIRQTVQSVITPSFATTSSTFQKSNSFASITISAGSKVLIMTTAPWLEASGVDRWATIERNGTDLSTGGAGFAHASADSSSQCAMSFVDTPPAAGTYEYAVYIKNSNNSTTIRYGENTANANQVMILQEIR